MIILHQPENLALNLTSAIARHSADRTVCFKRVDGQPLTLACFLPEDLAPGENRSTIFLIHGGGWSNRKVFAGQNEWQGDYLGFLARYYADRGFVCIAIEYRLIQDGGQKPGYGLPDLCRDCCDAVCHVVEQAQMYGIDPERLYLLGESAGGYLAAMLPSLPAIRPIHFRKLLLVNPITDLNMENWYKFVPPYCSAMELSPVNRITAETPETILIHGTADEVVSPGHSELFERRMGEKQRPCELHLLDGAHHAFLLAEYYRDGTDFCKTAIGILDQKLFADEGRSAQPNEDRNQST